MRIKPKNKKCKICERDDRPLFSKGACLDCSRKASVNKSIQKKRTTGFKIAVSKIKKSTTRMLLITKLDSVFSIYIRRKYANKRGKVKCYTCPASLPIKNIQCGHLHVRGNKSTRWDENNARPQCSGCNMHKSGNVKIFMRRLTAELGEDKMMELRIKSKQIFKAHDFELEALIQEYENKTISLNTK